jgi:hypothetical protein
VGWPVPLAALAVLQLLLLLPLRRAVVRHAALGRALLAVRRSASKRTPQILAASVAGIGQEENPALLATAPAGPQMGVEVEDRAQLDVIRTHQSADTAVTVPIRAAVKLLLDFQD